MNIGIPKEIKNNENRVAITPWGVLELTRNKHQVFIEQGAGLNSGFTDEEYQNNGATIVGWAEEAWAQDLIIKVKEPLASEYQFLRKNQMLFTYLHLADNKPLTDALLKAGTTAIAYETINVNGELPLLKPMSEVAGRRSVIFGATLLEKHNQDAMGILFSSVPGVDKTKVVVVGGGVAGLNAATMALGLGAEVTVLELGEQRIRFLDEVLNHQAKVLKSNHFNLTQAIKEADLVISSVLIPGALAPKLITEEMVKSMKPNSVIIDIAIDQGGSVETITKATSHDDPIFIKHGVIHSAVANIPGIVPKTSTIALTNATFEYVLKIANLGFEKALTYKNLNSGLNCYQGHLTNKPVADALQLEHHTIDYLRPNKLIDNLFN